MSSGGSITITGYLARDAEMRYTPGGSAVVNFTIPVDTGFGDKKQTTWWKNTMFGTRAEKIVQYLKKGSLVMVVGVPKVEEYEKKDGSKGTSPCIDVKEITLLKTKGDAPEEQEVEDDEIIVAVA